MAASFNKVAVVGAGAVGSFFGAMLARAGHRVVLIARPAHVQAIARDGLRLDMGGRVESIRGRGQRRHRRRARRRPDPLLRQVDRHRDRRRAPWRRTSLPARSCSACRTASRTRRRSPGIVDRTVVPAVVYVATAMGGPGLVRHHGRGDLVIGALADAGASAVADPSRRCRRWSISSPPAACRCASRPT